MPSAPSSTSASIQSLSDALKQTNTLITRLARLPFHPGSEDLDSPNSVRLELAQDIHDSLKQLEEDVELLTQDLDDAPSSTHNHNHITTSTATSNRRRSTLQDSTRTSAHLARLNEDLRHARGHFRRAQLIAKRNSEAAKQKEREITFAAISLPPASSSTTTATTNDPADLFAARRKHPQQQQKQLSKDDQLITASTDITAALRRTHALLSTELSRSRFAQETFDESTAALEGLGEHYSDLEGLLTNSKTLLGTLLRSQKSDTWYLETAFYLLLATLGWLFFRRILFGPFVKLPLFLTKVGWFMLNWTLLKPVWLFLTSIGVITTRTLAPSSSPAVDLPRTSLIVKPSAKSGWNNLPGMPDKQHFAHGVPAGSGGGGAKSGPDGKVAEEIAAMHERAEGVVRRGDGTVLEERSVEEQPRNPKKKGFVMDEVEEAKQRAFEEGVREGERRRKRDEL